MKYNVSLFAIILFFIPIYTQAQNNIDVLILNKNYDQALAELDKEIAKSPDAALYLKQGIVYENMQDYQNALRAFLNGLQTDPNNIIMLEETAECFSILGNNRDAVAFYEKALQVDPNNLALAGKLGRVHINMDDYKTAFNVFSGIYEKDSSNVYWNKQLAYCSYRVFQREKARDLYEKVLAANPRDHGTYINLIHCYNWKKEGDAIMATIDSGLVQFPADKELIFEKAMFYYRAKRYELAMLQFEKYLETEKQPAFETLMNYGISTYFAGQEEKAMDIFGDLKLLSPNDPLVMYYQSLCNRKLKNFDDAIELMTFAIEATVPDYVSEMYHHLGQMYGQQRMFKESIEALNKAYELNPGKTELLFEIATTYEEYNSNKTLALNYYRIYLTEAGESAKNAIYALERIERLKEDMFFDE
ncbi:tetratricopeptide repeat protein [Draconibacterium sp. IB214405]|uniref:tetratricopeptide repeat protein n=1 Tax=Draconibacterium sp. IB214405 TaxID=3097352 RepID=UPI002A179ED5|nr:tetratricopeptide repeat protein [Draconibacterium sp. IB214405]MDX8339567.1 tetratricopeptide repeat protein [Draconibacterium sp. IB214405]